MATGFMMSDLLPYRYERKACKHKDKSHQSTHYTDVSQVMYACLLICPVQVVQLTQFKNNFKCNLGIFKN